MCFNYSKEVDFIFNSTVVLISLLNELPNLQYEFVLLNNSTSLIVETNTFVKISVQKGF